MLGFIRRSVTSWVGIAVMVIALGAMTITLFQAQAPDTGSGPGGKQAVMAKVGKATIGESELSQAVENAVENERQTNENATAAQFVETGGTGVVLQQLIIGRLVTEYGAAHRMTVSRRMVDGQIASIPAFQVNGKFDENRYRQFLQSQSVKEDALRAGIASDLLRDQLLKPVAALAAVPQGMVDPFVKLLLEVHEGTVLPVPSATMPAPGTPDAKALEAFYSKNKAAFTVPERRNFRFAMLDNEALRAKAAPDEAAVEKYYKEHIATYGGVEKRDILQVVLQKEADARAFIANVNGGASFVAAAQKLGFAPEDVTLGTLAKADLEKETSPAVADAAFGLEKGKLSAPVKGAFGYHVLEVTRVLPASPTPFASVKASIAKQLADERFADLQSALIGKIGDRFDSGEPFADVAKSVKASVRSITGLTRDGNIYDSEFTPMKQNLPPALLQKVFAADPSDGPQVVEVGDGQYALFDIADVVAPSAMPLKDIRSRVVAAWQQNARFEAAKKLAGTLAAAASKGKSLADVAAGHALPPVQRLAVRRIDLTQAAQQGQQIPPPVLMMVSLPEGRTHILPAPNGEGWFAIKSDAVRAGDKEAAHQLAEPVRQELKREVGDEFLDSFMQVVGRKVGVVRYPAQLKAFNRKLVGGED